MARRRRLLKVALSDEEYAVVRQRAAAHRRMAATWARSVLLGERGATKDADAWWDSLPPARREQVHRWVAGAHSTAGPPPGQLTMLEGD